MVKSRPSTRVMISRGITFTSIGESPEKREFSSYPQPRAEVGVDNRARGDGHAREESQKDRAPARRLQEEAEEAPFAGCRASAVTEAAVAARITPVTFTSGDGETSIPSYLATPDRDGSHPVVLILRGVAGPDDGYTEIARRLAEWGYVALMHGWKVRGADPTDAPVYADLQGAMTFLGSVGQADLKRLAVFGFCRGGVHAFMAARAHPEIRAIVVFHGFAFRPARAQRGDEPSDRGHASDGGADAGARQGLHVHVLRGRSPRLRRAHAPRLCRGCGEAELRRGQALPGDASVRPSTGVRLRWPPTDGSRSS